MYDNDASKMAQTGLRKAQLFHSNPWQYLIYSILAGAYIGLGTLIIFTLGGYLAPAHIPGIPLFQALTFPLALSLVVFAGAELFTGNVLVMNMASLHGTVSWKTTATSLFFCYLGNLIGSILLSLCFLRTGLLTGAVSDFFFAAALKKTLPGAGALFFRGILCNFLVCLAVWGAHRSTSEAGKLMMIFWCVFAFVAMGFDHCVANMTAFAVGLFGRAPGLTVTGAVHNLFWVTLGNWVGGMVLVALPYAMGRHKD